MEIHERIQIIIKTNNHTAASFADLVGVQRSSISHIMSGRNKPSLDFLQKTLKAFPRVDAEWLITGIQNKQSAQIVEKTTVGKPEATENASSVKEELPKKVKKIEKIIVFYTDGTYELTVPTGQSQQNQ